MFQHIYTCTQQEYIIDKIARSAAMTVKVRFPLRQYTYFHMIGGSDDGADSDCATGFRGELLFFTFC